MGEDSNTESAHERQRSEVFRGLLHLHAENRLRDVKDRKDGLDGFLQMRKYYLRLHHNAGRFYERMGRKP